MSAKGISCLSYVYLPSMLGIVKVRMHGSIIVDVRGHTLAAVKPRNRTYILQYR